MTDLVCHARTPPHSAGPVRAEADRDEDARLVIRYQVFNAGEVLSGQAGRAERTDELWRTTCFELFASGHGLAYREFNFSPCGAWAAYDFAARRTAMRPASIAVPPSIHTVRDGDTMVVRCRLAPEDVEGFDKLGISAVIEEANGVKSYWALSHADDTRPDFHDPACFALPLKAAAGR